MHTLAQLFCGYSVFAAGLLALTHFRSENYQGRAVERALGVILAGTLGALQFGHFLFLTGHPEAVQGGAYRAALFAVAPLFYLFAQPLIKAPFAYRSAHFFHLLPVGGAAWLSTEVAFPAAFALGTIYLAVLATRLYALRAQHDRFHLEMGFLVGLLALGLAVVGLVFVAPLIERRTFFACYSAAIGSAFLLAGAALHYAPRLPEQLGEAAREAYGVSTLGGVDCVAKLAELERLNREEKLYENPDLDLESFASRLGLTAHQLSELVNAHLGKGFSRYVRECRVDAARSMLLAEPDASVLSVGLNCGFSSQSNFYAAFREITGMTPGQFRKIAPRRDA